RGTKLFELLQSRCRTPKCECWRGARGKAVAQRQFRDAIHKTVTGLETKIEIRQRNWLVRVDDHRQPQSQMADLDRLRVDIHSMEAVDDDLLLPFGHPLASD